MNRWNGKRILIIGAARQGQALARFLSQKGARVILNDKRSREQMKEEMKGLVNFSIEWVLGDHPSDLLDRVELVCLSGGVPLSLPFIVEAQKRGLPLSNDSQIFLESVQAAVIGITGSAGKTTTTTLVGRMAQAALAPSQKAWVGGNIGLPLVEYLPEIKKNDIVVLELSSFQLEQMTLSPHIAAVLNITPNHLDRHLAMQAYTSAKARILQFQGPSDIAILDREDEGSSRLRDLVAGQLITFGIGRPTTPQETAVFVENEVLLLQEKGQITPIMGLKTIQLRGRHNLRNVLAACAIGHAAKFSIDSMIAAIEGFAGVEHRLEMVRNWRGITWINDSIATAPERTLAALASFTEPIVLLLGGRDKNLPWDELAAQIRARVKHVILFGEAAEIISRAIGQPGANDELISIQKTNGFEDALKSAAAVAESGNVVLLSPGCTSYDSFHDFEERGNTFKKWVNQLP
ncbi:MAG: UDP-N-acetylmuramoyl-L-alanine--D-glutamate ligase [Chloroflexi bacterium]|nr:UDP-N-acetylmuramoyl-L-alanine--D-glutamate ligase [Chloroflexota bacterium]